MDGIMTVRPDWHDYFLSQAVLASTRSPDIQTKVGCVFADSNHRVIATGYNGYVSGAPDSHLPNTRPDKYPLMLHAEKNALLSCARQGQSTLGLSAYVFSSPCWNCFYDMIGAGICKIHWTNNPFLKMPGFLSTEEWNTHSFWLENKIQIYYYPLETLKLTNNIFETLYGKVYNTISQQ